MKYHREDNSSHKPYISPWWHRKQALIFTQAVAAILDDIIQMQYVRVYTRTHTIRIYHNKV